jgi:hypothetical protein
VKHELEGEEITVFADALPKALKKLLWKRGFRDGSRFQGHPPQPERLLMMLIVDAELVYELDDNSFDYDYGEISGTHDPGGSIAMESCECTAFYDDEGEAIKLSPDDYKRVKAVIEDALEDEYTNGKGSELLYEAYEPPEPDYDERDYEINGGSK